MLVVAMHAINTLAACEREGGARKLFAELLSAPDGELARRYRALEFATDCVAEPPPDPRDAPPPADADSGWSWRTFGRGLLQQLMCALIAAALIQVFLEPMDVAARLPPSVKPETTGHAPLGSR